MTERRSHRRVEVSCPVLYFSSIYQVPRVVSTLDLSPWGARIRTPYTLMVGEKFELSMAIHQRTIRCRAVVERVLCSDGEGPTAGVRFEEISEEDTVFLEEFIANLPEQRK